MRYRSRCKSGRRLKGSKLGYKLEWGSKLRESQGVKGCKLRCNLGSKSGVSQGVSEYVSKKSKLGCELGINWSCKSMIECIAL